MRESFVIHSEYIEDLPQEYKSTYLMYIYEYGINGTVPELSGLEKTIWQKIQRRIDADIESWNETKNARSEAGKKGNSIRWKKNKESQSDNCDKDESQNIADNKKDESDDSNLSQKSQSDNCESQNIAKIAVSVSDNVNDNVSVNVNVQESQIRSEAKSEIPAKTDTDNLYTKISKWFSDKELEVSESSRVQLYYRLSNIKYDLGFLDYCWNYILGQYPKKTKNEVTSLFVKAALTFQNLVNNYATLLSTKRAEAEAEERKEASAKIRKSAPKTCSCGDFFCLPENEGGILTVRCPCGNYSQYSPTERRWIFTDKKQVESFDLMNFRVGQKVGVST